MENELLRDSKEFTNELLGNRVYLVYQDWDDGLSQHVVAKNRKEAYKKVDFQPSKVAWRPWLSVKGSRVVNSFGKDYGSVVL